MSVFHDIGQMAIKKCEKERHNMFTIDVSICHHDDAVIAKFFWIETICNAHTQGDNEGFEFFKFDDFVESRPFGIQNFSTKRENRLELAVTALLGTTTCRISLDDEGL